VGNEGEAFDRCLVIVDPLLILSLNRLLKWLPEVLRVLSQKAAVYAEAKLF
jgi:hypothetical protein